VEVLKRILACLGVRYHLGLGDLYDQGRSHNRVWQFSVGLKSWRLYKKTLQSITLGLYLQ
jgi:hypothetical protein